VRGNGCKSVLCSCAGCGSEVSREDSFYELLLNIRGHKELGECLKEFFQVPFYFYSLDFIGSRPSDHYFRSVCLFVCLSVCLFVCAEFFSAIFDPISIKLERMLHVWV